MVHQMASAWDTGPYDYGLRNAARARMAQLAEKAGQDLGTFLRSCGLDVIGYAAVWRADEREGNLVPSKPRLRVKATAAPTS
nr:hypothetical protein [uncultured Roseococcus sp.]